MAVNLYPSLNRAQLSYEYLHTNSTTHEFLFGAIVELVDNSKDANASKMDIYTMKKPELRGGHMLCFLDDGYGMSPGEAAGTITFGYSKKRLDNTMIGQYGNGLKSGAMRIGQDFILFTKKDEVISCVFLSRTFHEAEKIDEVIVPMPSFDAATKQPLPCEDENKHQMEMDIILKYSPFKSEAEFFKQFDEMKGPSGTLVIIYNLKLLDNGDPELDFTSDPIDIQLRSDGEGKISSLVPERRSLRAYLSVLYESPHMKIYCQHKKIRTKRIACSLYKPKMYKFASNRFINRAEKDAASAKDLAKRAQEKASEANSKLKDFERKHGTPTSRPLMAELRKLQDQAKEAAAEAKYRKDMAEEKQKKLKEPKVLTFFFGLNLERREHDGIFVYNSGRLIKMYERVGIQNEGGILGAGVVGIVDVPFMVMEPTHNKQDFADGREYHQLLRNVGEYLTQYWKDLNLAADTKAGGVSGFWRQYGYLSSKWEDPPENDEKFRRARMQAVNRTLQCDGCLKWRTVPFQQKYVNEEYSDYWVCKDNPDTQFNKCTAPERKVTFPEGKLVKETVTVDKKKAALEKRIEKQQEELKKLQNLKTVTSSRALRSKEKTPEPDNRRANSRTPATANANSSRKNDAEPSPQKKPKTKAAALQRLQSAAQSSEEEEEEDSDDDDEEEESEEEETTEKELQRKPTKAATAPARAAPTRMTAMPPNKRSGAGAAPPATSKKSYPAPSVTPAQRVAALAQRKDNIKTAATATTSAAKTPPVSSSASTQKDRRQEISSPKPSPTARKTRREVTPEPQVQPKRNRTSDQIPSTLLKIESDADTTVHLNGDDTQAVVSSSSTSDKERADDAVTKLRRCYYYFLPPNWRLTKENVSAMSPDEVLQQDLNEFFKAYESGLKALVAEHTRASQEAQAKLFRLRKDISTLLKSINPDFNLDANCDTEDVDNMVRACVVNTVGNTASSPPASQ